MKQAVAVVFLLTLAVLAGCSKGDGKAEAASTKVVEPLAIKTVSAELRNVDKTISITGSLNPDETVNVSAEVPGRIASILVDFGQNVRKGQVLVEFDKQELGLGVERSKAALAQSLARIGLDPAQENVKPESTPAIRQAAAQMDDARSKYENAAKLVKTGDISQERFTELEKLFRAREAAYEASRDDVRTQIASIQALRAEVKLAQKRLNDATVRAPFDGAISAKLVSPGQYMKENTPILTLVKTSPLRLRAEIPESGAGAVRVGTSLTFTTEAAPDKQFHAIVRELNPSMDAKSRSLTAEARLTGEDARLRPGMFVQVQLVLSRNAEIVVVPSQAVYTVAGLTKVFVIRNEKAIELKIAPGQNVGGWVEVPRGQINPGDRVAVSALTQLVNELPVRSTAKS